MDAVSGCCWRDMESIGDLGGMVEMLVQGVNVFKDAATPTNDEVVDCDDVLGVLREADSTNVLEIAHFSTQHARFQTGTQFSLWKEG